MTANESRSVWSGSLTSISKSMSEPSANLISDEDTLQSDEDDDPPLVGEDDDPLIPTPPDIFRTFCDGKETWQALLIKAKNLPSGLWPAKTMNPFIALRDVPGLPEHLPRSRTLYGRPCWDVPSHVGDTNSITDGAHDGNNTSLVHGRRVAFRLFTEHPIRCDTFSESASIYLGNRPEMTDSLAVLTMCWSYILSVRFLEMQRQEVQYSVHRLQTFSRGCHGTSTIDLDGASPALVRWLCAVLSPNLGWNIRNKGLLPPWTACLVSDVQLVTVSELAADTLLPPSSSEATELLLELCRLFRLETDTDGGSELESLTPYKAAFVAALMLPFYNSMDLQPRFPPPHLSKNPQGVAFSRTHEENIRQYVHDLRYFMTLSIHPPSLGSVLWSIFWQPDIDCNLVSPWFASMLDTLQETINGNQLETLLKVFVSRRPRVALWWLGLFLLGDLSVLGWIRRYAETMAEKYGFASLSPPDPMVSSWSGSKQSFLDLEREAVYLGQSDSVSRADLLRCRFNFKLQDSASTPLSWRPFGYLRKQDIEPDLWPSLETKSARQYHSFVWYSGRAPYPTSSGFRRETGRVVKGIPDDLNRRSSKSKYSPEYQHNFKTAPSRDSTMRMISFLVEDVAGGRHWANAAMSYDYRQHPWLRDWEGLDSMEAYQNNAVPDIDIVKSPSWFLERWIRWRHEQGDGREEYDGEGKLPRCQASL